MPDTATRFEAELAQPRLKPVYLLAGEEFLVLEAADRLRARSRELGFEERDVFDVDARFDWDELAAAGAGMSLFATLRMIDLRIPNGRPGRQGSAAITAWCKQPPADTVLLITCTQWSRNQAGAWTRAIAKVGAVLEFRAPWPNEWPRWLAGRLASRGVKAERAAVDILAERVEGNLLAAAQEIDKLALLHKGGVLDVAGMRELVGSDARYNVFKLTDAAFAGDAARALRIFEGLEAGGEDLVPLMSWVGNQLQVAMRLAEADNFASQAKAERLWKAREQLFRQALRRAPQGHWSFCLGQAALIDRMIKGRAGGNPWRAAERLVLLIAQPRLRERLA